MRVLVTGSSGFIGQHLAAALSARGHEVIGVDKEPPRSAIGYVFQRCDLLDSSRLRDVVASAAPDAVMHLAARTDLDEKVSLSGYAANIDGVANLIAAIRATPSVRRAIYTSTQLVCRVGYSPASDDDYLPNTLYGESKVAGERIIRRENGGGVAWCIVRPTTVWGPGMNPHYQRFLRMIRNGTYFHIGRSPRMKSFGFVGNVAYQYCQMLEVPAEQIHRKTFYVGDYEPVSLRAWADQLALNLGARPIRTVPETIARAAARVGDGINALGFRAFPFNSFRLNNVLTEYTFDLSTTREVCGDTPYSFETAAAITADWLRHDV
jgi:GlcNAc-P-P-Und epimerase